MTCFRFKVCKSCVNYAPPSCGLPEEIVDNVMKSLFEGKFFHALLIFLVFCNVFVISILEIQFVNINCHYLQIKSGLYYNTVKRKSVT